LGHLIYKSHNGDAGYGVPGSPQWNYLWIMALDDDELRDFVLEIGSEKVIEAFEWRQHSKLLADR